MSTASSVPLEPSHAGRRPSSVVATLLRGCDLPASRRATPHNSPAILCPDAPPLTTPLRSSVPARCPSSLPCDPLSRRAAPHHSRAILCSGALSLITTLVRPCFPACRPSSLLPWDQRRIQCTAMNELQVYKLLSSLLTKFEKLFFFHDKHTQPHPSFHPAAAAAVPATGRSILGHGFTSIHPIYLAGILGTCINSSVCVV